MGQATEVPGGCPGQAARLVCAEGPEGTGCAFPPDTPAGPDVPLLGRASDGHSGRRVGPFAWLCGRTAWEAALCPPARRCCPCPRCPRSVTGRASGRETKTENLPRDITALRADSVHTDRARGAGPRMKREPLSSGKARAPRPAWGLLSWRQAMGRWGVPPGIVGT